MAGRAPLAVTRVAVFTWVWAGPFCTLQLAHLGAEVIRVETATRPCVTRLLPPFADFEPGPNRSGYFNQYNQGKKSVALDLKRPEAIEAAKRLCAASDVVVENFAAGVMERMGLGWDVLHALRADLIMIALSGYGATGPDADKVSYGPAQVPLSGMSSVTGYRGFPPMHVGISYGDPTGGLHGAVAVLAALLHRARTGQGQYVDLSQWETSMAVLPEAICAWTMNGAAPERDGNRDAHMAPHGVFRAAGEEDAVRRHVRVAVAVALGRGAVHRPGADRLREHGHRGLPLREVDVLALAGARAVEEGRQHGDRPVEPARRIAVRDADMHGREAAVAGHRGHPRERHLRGPVRDLVGVWT